MSILHIALAYTPFINDGDLLAPVLVKNDANDLPKVWKKTAAKKETAAFVNDLLVQVVNHPDGTGADAKISGKQMAGKTGTAELKQSKDEEGKENGFFVAYDNDNPELLVAMMIENVENRGGSKFVVPKVKNIFLELDAN